MKCPFCDNPDTQVKDSRATHNNTIIRRRRYCDKCKIKFSTAERIYLKELYVIKRSGMRKSFDREKIKSAIETATRKRNIPISEIEKIVDEIIRQIESSNVKEISTKRIGELLLRALLKVDLVAYVRFASVYKDFSSPTDFINFINSINQANHN
jgi:transcriptional repressor NrdR